jgi:hypothetical protein
VDSLVNQLFPMMAWLTSLLPSWMPGWVKLVLLGIVSSLITMLLYRALSDQSAIKRRKAEMKALRQRLIAADDDIKVVLQLSRANLGHALALLGRVTGPAILSSLPVGIVVVWLASYWTYAVPTPGTPVPIGLAPSGDGIEFTPSNLLAASDATGSRLIWPEPKSTLRVESGGQILWEGEADQLATTASVGQWRWWNAILGNPAGYLSPDGPLTLWSLDLPRREYLSFGMDWMRGWEFVYFVTVGIVSLGLKLVMRIQ